MEGWDCWELALTSSDVVERRGMVLDMMHGDVVCRIGGEGRGVLDPDCALLGVAERDLHENCSR